MPDNATFRILDANFNRSREALRVMEEYARFVLDDASLTEAIKTERHRLSSAVRDCISQQDQPPSAQSPDSTPLASARGSDGESVVAYRDIVGDVGRGISAPFEFARADTIDVIQAAAKRLSESLRAIEEYGKTINPDFAAAIERLRYRGYELERRFFATVRARQRFGDVRLYVILTEAICHGGWFETAEAALRGGADCLQLREKDLPDRELLVRARRLAALCRKHSAIFIVNDRPDIALAAGANGVHLGQEDLPVSAARRMLPASHIVGVSTHTLEQADAAIAEAPDYIAVGPMFDSPTKPQDLIAGPETLAAARTRTALPLVAIGGIDQSNVGAVLSAGPSCVCVCRAAISQPDVAGSVARLRSIVEAGCVRIGSATFREKREL